ASPRAMFGRANQSGHRSGPRCRGARQRLVRDPQAIWMEGGARMRTSCNIRERRFLIRRRTMGKRRRAREAAIQYHFWRDLQHGAGPEKIDDFFELCPVKPTVREFAQPLIEGLVAHLPEIDERIRRYSENFDFNRIAAVDRNILRLAIYEMLY